MEIVCEVPGHDVCTKPSMDQTQGGSMHSGTTRNPRAPEINEDMVPDAAGRKKGSHVSAGRPPRGLAKTESSPGAGHPPFTRDKGRDRRHGVPRYLGFP